MVGGFASDAPPVRFVPIVHVTISRYSESVRPRMGSRSLIRTSSHDEELHITDFRVLVTPRRSVCVFKTQESGHMAVITTKYILLLLPPRLFVGHTTKNSRSCGFETKNWPVSYAE